jgi:hypothetical protein
MIEQVDIGEYESQINSFVDNDCDPKVFVRIHEILKFFKNGNTEVQSVFRNSTLLSNIINKGRRQDEDTVLTHSQIKNFVNEDVFKRLSKEYFEDPDFERRKTRAKILIKYYSSRVSGAKKERFEKILTQLDAEGLDTNVLQEPKQGNTNVEGNRIDKRLFNSADYFKNLDLLLKDPHKFAQNTGQNRKKEIQLLLVALDVDLEELRTCLIKDISNKNKIVAIPIVISVLVALAFVAALTKNVKPPEPLPHSLREQVTWELLVSGNNSPLKDDIGDHQKDVFFEVVNVSFDDFVLNPDSVAYSRVEITLRVKNYLDENIFVHSLFIQPLRSVVLTNHKISESIDRESQNLFVASFACNQRGPSEWLVINPSGKTHIRNRASQKIQISVEMSGYCERVVPFEVGLIVYGNGTGRRTIKTKETLNLVNF